jgi:hypothetical protein
VAKRNTGRRGRSRKRRPNPQGAGAAPGAAAPAVRVPPRRVGVLTDMKAAGERPPPPWHPLPLSELLILVGVIGAVIAWRRGIAGNGALLGAGIGAVAIGSVEVALREHLSGFRPHTGMLAVIPAIVFHSAVVLVLIAAGVRVAHWLNLALLPVDLVLVAACFKLLRARYVDARRARTAVAGR